jgi:phosphatidylglycerol:prolipoprotein diacylglycerol transferase
LDFIRQAPCNNFGRFTLYVALLQAMTNMKSHGLIGPEDLWTMHIHPVQLYESTGELLNFFLLLLVRSQKKVHGQVLAVYLLTYPILRSSLELLRGDIERGVTHAFGGVAVSTSQLISIGVFSGGLFLLVLLLRRGSRAKTAPAAPAAA